MTYYVEDEVQIILTGGTTDTSFDTMIIQEGVHADADVENDLYSFSGVTPPFTGANITEDISSASNWKTAARVFDITGQIERKNSAETRYLSILGLERDSKSNILRHVGGGIIGRFKATPTTRTKTVSVTSSYRSSPLADE